MRVLKIFACALLTLMVSASASTVYAKAAKVYNIKSFGAKSDTTVLSTVAVQKAIDKCSQDGGGRVLVPAGSYVIGSIKLKSNVELHLEKDAYLLGSRNLADYADDNIGAIEGPAFDRTLLYGHNLTGVKITGEGTIDGRGHRVTFPVGPSKADLKDRPMLMRFIACTDLQFIDVTFKDAASWCCHLVDCDDIIARNITINSHVNKNNDGFDIDGCKNMLIEDCDIFSGDDAICPKSTTDRITENIIVRNCRVSSNTSAFKCGTSSRGGFRNISITNCDFSDTNMGAIKIQMVDGGILENIYISDIVMNNVEGPIFIRLGNRGRLYDRPTEQTQGQEVTNEGGPMGAMRNITIRNIKAVVDAVEAKRSGIMITGIPGHYVENVVLENIDISYPGGVKEGEYLTEVAEDEARYPEQFFFGVLPAWGAYIRHAKNVEFNNIKMSVRDVDARDKMYFEDVINFNVK